MEFLNENNRNSSNSSFNRFNDVVESASISFRDIIDIVIAKWYWFLISVAVCMCVAVYFIRTQVPRYQRTAVVLVKQDNKGNNSPIQFTTMGNMGSKGVENELYMFRTRSVLRPVVRKLGLDVTYTMKGILRDYPLYNEGPFHVSFLSDFVSPVSFTLEYVDNTHYQISRINGNDVSMKCQFGATVDVAGEKIVVNPVPGQLELYSEKKIKVSRISEDAAAAVYQAGITTAVAAEGTSLIAITCVDSHPVRANDIITSIVEEYNKSILEDKNYVTTSTAAFLDDRIRVISRELGQVEDELTSFKQKNNIVDLSSAASQYVSESYRVRNEAISLETDITVAESIREYLADETRKNSIIPNISGGGDDNGVGNQIEKYNELILQRNRLLTNSGDNNVIIRNMDINLEAMRESISGAVDNYISSLKVRLGMARKVEEELLGNIRSVPDNERVALNIMRQQEIKETLYTYLLQKREENALQMAVTETNIRLIEDPVGPSGPILPVKSTYTTLALIIGLILPLGYIILSVLFNTKVRSRRDIEDILTLPIIGEIPETEKKLEKGELAVSENSNNLVSEAFRMLRANLNFMASDARVLMFISTMPDEGKTFVSRNFAQTLAFSGKRVILIDTDLRKRTQSLELNADTDNGLTYYLSGHICDLKSIIVKDVFKGVDLLPAGAVPPNPSELLMSDRFDKMIEELRNYYDYIILDNVPAQAVADASVVNRVADLTFYVIRVDYLDRRSLVDIERLKRENKFRNMSVILNGCIVNKKRYGYGYGYGYGNYGYGYGYGHKHESRFGIRRRLKKIFKL